MFLESVAKGRLELEARADAFNLRYVIGSTVIYRPEQGDTSRGILAITRSRAYVPMFGHSPAILISCAWGAVSIDQIQPVASGGIWEPVGDLRA